MKNGSVGPTFGCFCCRGLGHQDTVVVSALVDSGVAINLIDQHLVEELRLATRPSETPLRVMVVDNRPIWNCLITCQTIPLILQDLIDHYVITYSDYILIYSASYDDHISHVTTVLTRLLCHHEKCEFHKDSITLLGYMISKRGVEMDCREVRVVTDWPELTNVKELQ
ncbi:hypothetical protein QTP70_011223 [Hemibagrus guttatus]|uniref:Reverse transcriptase domain-containing protein n=1 Tax=Hemibagrus guttatus TaxID=175788 RepID=A0AAE0QQ74_9TELE|nr:hypothetical protein QTP70_011223 [Hemibagrus guttatus]